MLRRNSQIALLKERYTELEDEKEDVTWYWMTLRKIKDTGI
jgi:hypothetical protein